MAQSWDPMAPWWASAEPQWCCYCICVWVGHLNQNLRRQYSINQWRFFQVPLHRSLLCFQNHTCTGIWDDRIKECVTSKAATNQRKNFMMMYKSAYFFVSAAAWKGGLVIGHTVVSDTSEGVILPPQALLPQICSGAWSRPNDHKLFLLDNA